MRPKNLKKYMKLNWDFQRGGEVLEKIPSVREVWIFSGTTHYVHNLILIKNTCFV